MVEGEKNIYPTPVINDDNAFLYEGFEHKELRIQKCNGCSALRFPPSPMCPHCGAMDWDYIVSSGDGFVYSYTVHHHPPIPPLETPHPVVLVELTEGIRFLAGIRNTPIENIKIGMRVALTFFECGSGHTMPVFEPADLMQGSL